jgi:hypothetical protein
MRKCDGGKKEIIVIDAYRCVTTKMNYAASPMPFSYIYIYIYIYIYGSAIGTV